MNAPFQGFADAQAALPFVIGQGRNIEAQVYRTRYPAYDYAAVLPVVTEGNAWAIGTQFFTVDTTGEAKFIAGAANDLPFSQVNRATGTHDFAMIGAGWEWNMEEINQASLYGVNLGAEKALGADRNLERKLYSIAMTGATEKNWTGFCNYSGITEADADTTGTGSSTYWADKTVDNILADINTAMGAVRTGSAEVEYVDTMALPPGAFRDLATRRLGAGDGLITLLEYIRRNNIYTAETGRELTILPVRDLATASTAGEGRGVFYRRDPEVIRFHLPMPKMMLQPRQKSLMAYESGVVARTGGVEVRLPKAMYYLDEIAA